jgi:repressor LexA
MPRTRPTQLSDKERIVLRAVEDLIDQTPYPPSIREICRLANINAPSQVSFYLTALQEKGYIEREAHVSRSIRLLRSTEPLPPPVLQPRIPILGRIQAGEPVPIPSSDFALYDDESFIEVSEKMLPRTSDPLFALEVSGDSMRDALVVQGDILVLRSTQHAQNGEMVAAWLRHKNETTLKYYYREGNLVKLQPANPEYRPIFLGLDEVDVQGLVVFIFRQFM